MTYFRKVLLMIFLSLSSIFIYAQDSPFQFGIKGGGNLFSTSMNIKDYADKKIKIGYQIGLSAEYEFSDNFYLETGVYFVTKGVKLRGDIGSSAEKTHWKQTFNMQYLELPLLATYKIELVSDTKIFFNIGPYVGYGIGGKASILNDYVNLDNAVNKDKLDIFGDNRMKEIDFGLKFGLGLEFEKFTFGWSYEFGLIDVEHKNNELNYLLNNKHYKHKGIMLLVGYKF